MQWKAKQHKGGRKHAGTSSTVSRHRFRTSIHYSTTAASPNAVIWIKGKKIWKMVEEKEKWEPNSASDEEANNLNHVAVFFFNFKSSTMLTLMEGSKSSIHCSTAAMPCTLSFSVSHVFFIVFLYLDGKRWQEPKQDILNIAGMINKKNLLLQ